MLKSISLENYKCFKDRTDIEIAPLTVLCGVNSSGKSSILKSLLMLKQSYENDSASHSMLFSGDYVDNGSFDDIVYHLNGNDIDEEATFTISTDFLIQDPSNNQGKISVKRQDTMSFRELKRVFNQTNIQNVKYFQISVTIKIQRPSYDKLSFEFYTESNTVKEYHINLFLLDENKDLINDVPRYIYVIKNEKIKNTEKNGWIIEWSGIPPLKSSEIKHNYNCTCYFSGLQIKNIYIDNLKKGLSSAIPNILSIFKIVSFQSDGFNFIAPLREQPMRRYSINGDVNSVGVSGEKTPILLAKEFDNRKIDCCPPKIKNGKIIWPKKNKSFKDLVSTWMSYLDLGTISLGGTGGLVEININNHNIVDVGFGVSQALPIIVQGLYMIKDESLFLEQPEIHLHPEMQLQMADFLIALAKSEKNVIVETHSDHFVNRIIHRVMQNYDELNKIIKIYIVEKNDETSCSSVRLKQIDKYKGTEKDKNKFFFTQYDSEITDIVDTGLTNMLEKCNDITD